MRTDNSRFLREAAAHRRTQAAQRATAAIRQLDATGQPVTFATVAKAAGISRSWLYRDQTTRSEIERLRHNHPTTPTPPPSEQRGSTESWRHRYETLLETNRQLTENNQQLRDQVATLLGERRANRTHGPQQT